MRSGQSQQFSGLRPEAIDFNQQVRLKAGSGRGGRRNSSGDWQAAHVCRRRGSIVVSRGRSVQKAERFGPGDIIMQTNSGLRIFHPAPGDAEFRFGDGGFEKERILAELDALQIRPARPGLFASLVAKIRQDMILSGQVQKRTPDNHRLAVGKSEQIVSSLREEAGTLALQRMVIQWDKICKRHVRRDMSGTNMEEAIEAACRHEVKRVREKITALQKQIDDLKPYQTLSGGLKAAIGHAYAGTRGPDKVLYMSPSIAKTRLKELRKNGRKLIAARKAFRESASGRGIALNNPDVRAFVDKVKPTIRQSLIGLPAGFSLKDAMELKKIAQSAEIVMDHVSSLKKAKDAMRQYEASMAPNPGYEPDMAMQGRD